MGKYEILVGTAGILGLTSFGALVLRVYETKETTHLTPVWLMLNITAQILVLVYGFINKSIGLIMPATLFLSGLIFIWFIKITYPKEEKKLETDLFRS